MTKLVVCPLCEGTGYGDGLGDVTEMLHEDPDFAEDYRAGLYNRGCERCHGRNVVPGCQTYGCNEPAEETPSYWDESERMVNCWEHLPDWQREDLESHYQTEAIMAAERRMGA